MKCEPENVVAKRPLIQTKLTPPRLQPSLISRPRLLEQLTAAIAPTPDAFHRRLTLIIGPAGYGKTTLAAQWINQLGLPAAWLSLDSSDDDVARFLRYLFAAVATVAPTAAAAAQAQWQSYPHPSEAEAVLTLLSNDLINGSQRLLLVLDDYHLLTAESIQQAVAFLLHHLPPQLHLLLISRSEPALPLAQWRARGELFELRQRDLRFSAAETAVFLQQTIPQPLDETAVSQLALHTEGWAVGLKLASLSLQNHPNPAHFLDNFDGSHRFIIDYLVEQVLAGQPPHVQTFLQKTAVLEQLCAPLCDAVLLQTSWDVADDVCLSNQQLLQQLEQHSLFLVPLDEQRRWYRYHHLFAEFLRMGLTVVDKKRLRQRASNWFAQQGALPEAIAYALAAGDAAAATHWLRQAVPLAFRTGELATVRGWLAALPPERLVADGDLVAYQGWLYWLAGEGEAAARWVAQVEFQPGGGKWLGLRACLALTREGGAAAHQLAQQALAKLAAGDSFFREMVLLVLAELQTLAGDLAGAEGSLREAQRLAPAVNIGVAVNLAQLLNKQGRRRAAVAICEELLRTQVDANGRLLPLAGLAYITLGELAYEANALSEAKLQIERGLTLAQAHALAGYQLSGKMALVPLLLARGDLDGALATVGEMRQLLLAADFGSFAPLLDGLEAVVWLRQGRLRLVEGWAKTAVLPHPKTAANLSDWLVWVRLLLQRGEMEAVRKLLHELVDIAEASGHRLLLITLYLLLAQVEPERLAVQALVQAIVLAEGEGYKRPFFNEGRTIVPLLRQVQAAAPNFVADLLAELEALPAALLGELEPLTEREQEVLRWLLRGHTNREIAAELMVTVGTIKKHLNNIYGKLGVRNRTQALVRLREQGWSG